MVFTRLLNVLTCFGQCNSCFFGVTSVPIFSNYSRTDITISVPGGTSYNGLYGEAPSERGTVFRLQLDEMVGISSLVELYESVGKSVIWICKRPKRVNDAFCDCEEV